MVTKNPALTKLLQVKSKIDFFKNLNDVEISKIVLNLKFQKFESKSIIFKEGCTQTNFLYFLLQGEINILKYSTVEEDDIFLTSFNQPTLFGEMRAFTNEPRSATAIAGQNGATILIFSIRSSEHTEYNEAFRKFYRNVIEVLSHKIRVMNARL